MQSYDDCAVSEVCTKEPGGSPARAAGLGWGRAAAQGSVAAGQSGAGDRVWHFHPL